MNVSLHQVTHRHGSVEALRGLSLTIADGELFCLLGPSGCGKTTLLRLLTGFLDPSEGEIRFGERPMNGIPPHERPVAMVFQNQALWPHLTMAQNVAYGLEVRRVPRAERELRTRQALELVRLETLQDRRPDQVSGGERQRAALARAIVVRPELLLLDEPLSSLDTPLRLEMRSEIRRLHEALRLTTLYVTHDPDEALSLADRLAVIRGGVVQQVATPRELLRRPASRFVAELLGPANWLEGRVESVADDGLLVSTALGDWRAEATNGIREGQGVWVGFRPMAVQFAPNAGNPIRCRVRKVTLRGAGEEYLLEAGHNFFLTAFERTGPSHCHLGFELTVSVSVADLMVVPR
jgi:ABC-type Fe3+/spermidine/putrescine transport system ATPase subunit